MKSMKRLVLMVALMMVAVVPFASAKAQAASCGLAEADCKVLADADANVAKLTSFQQDYKFSLKVDASGQKVEVTSDGTGVFSIDPKAVTGSDPTAALGALNLTLDINGATKGAGADQSGKVQVVVTNGVIYFNDGKAGWQGAKLSDILTSAMSSGGMGGGMSSNPQAAQLAGLANDPAIMQALAAIPNIKGFITLTKADGPEVGGVKTTAFTYNFDIKTLLSAKELTPILKAVAKASGPSATEMTDEQVAQIGALAGMFLKDSKFTVTRLVGADGLYHGLTIDLSATIDTSAMGGGASSAAAAPTTVALNLDVKLTKIGEKFEVKAPEGAKMMTPPAPAAAATAAK